MQQIGCHGLVWTGIFDEEGLRLAISKTKEAGFDLIELPLLNPYDFEIAAAKRLLNEYDLGVTGSLGLSPATDVSSEDPDTVKAGEELLGKALEVLSELGSEHLVGVLYSALKKFMEPATAVGRRNSVAAMRRLSTRAESLGIKISLEVVNRYETNIMNTGHQALAFLDEVGQSNAFVHLDTYHMNIEESGLFAPVVEAGARLGYAHIGESHRGYLGSGTVDFDSFFRALAHIDYDGPIVFESFSSAVMSPDLSRMLGIWRNLWSDSADLGAHANTFIRGQLRSVSSIAMH